MNERNERGTDEAAGAGESQAAGTGSDGLRPDASQAEAGGATGAIVGTVLGGPIGTGVGAAVGSVAGGAAEAAKDDVPDEFERTGEPGDDRGADLQDPRLGGHVGGSDPEHA